MSPILRDFPNYLETERLLIRAARPGDGAVLYEAVIESLDSLRPWMPWANAEITPEAEEAVARRMSANFLLREDLPLLLFKKGSSEFVGGSGLHRIDWNVPRFEIGYWVRDSCARQGFITEAVAGITNFAFDTLFAERVEIRMDDRNERSWRVAERLGFKLEGVLRRDARATSGELRDTRVYSRIRDEWLKLKAQRSNTEPAFHTTRQRQ